MSDSDSQRRSQSPDNAPGNRSRSREHQRGRPLRRQVPTPFRSPPRRYPPPVDQRVVFGGYVYQPPATAAPTPSAAPNVSPSNSTPGTAQNTPLPADTADDVDMGDDDGSTFVYNAPALPQLPTFNGSTKAERRTFIRQYNKYLDQINALQCNGTRPFVMPVSACMDVSTKKRLAMWTFGNRDYRTIKESEWEAWFGKAFDEEPQDLEVLKKRLTSAIPPPKNAKIEKNNDSGGGANRGTPANEQRSAMPARPKPKCVKCGKDDHKVSACPKCAPGEADKLLKEQLEKWEEARKKVAKLNQPVHQSLDREAKIEDIVSVSTTLLDTGSDVTLV
ncbi:hypothetical protein LEN26_003270, partial [Aphanomyces euteiches]